MNITLLQNSFPGHVFIGSFFLVQEPDNNIAEMEINLLDVIEENDAIKCTLGFPASEVSENFLKDWMQYRDSNTCDCVMMGINHDATPPLKRIGRLLEMAIIEETIVIENDIISAQFLCKMLHKDYEFYLTDSTQ